MKPSTEPPKMAIDDHQIQLRTRPTRGSKNQSLQPRGHRLESNSKSSLNQNSEPNLHPLSTTKNTGEIKAETTAPTTLKAYCHSESPPPQPHHDSRRSRTTTGDNVPRDRAHSETNPKTRINGIPDERLGIEKQQRRR
ncbi:unnamed protein product [Eruca vesicaria subsp. sativa]|uniref:Uncharacterized protein n=1 Tax=Eruca vesicaria subsp. sativa TaxID=29727 RepID=A0ABC8LFD6_ERUVS|nr:unnamed protein product [Eruca vesicaria subsp. sativa]